jgi:hypothetical protein
MVRLATGYYIIRGIIRLILLFLRMIGFLTVTALTSIWVGVPQAVTRIGYQWMREASLAGMPPNLNNTVRYAGYVFASITLVLGWLVLASLTTFILRLIFF